jgi:hypothetical protein
VITSVDVLKVLLVTGESWTPLNKAQQKEAEDKVTHEYTEALRKLAPGAGAYVNEVSRYTQYML